MRKRKENIRKKGECLTGIYDRMEIFLGGGKGKKSRGL